MKRFKSLDPQESELDLILEQQIKLHLNANFYPPVPESMVEPCVEAIKLANQGFYFDHVALPDNVEWHHRQHVPADELISTFHLEEWITNT